MDTFFELYAKMWIFFFLTWLRFQLHMFEQMDIWSPFRRCISWGLFPVWCDLQSIHSQVKTPSKGPIWAWLLWYSMCRWMCPCVWVMCDVCLCVYTVSYWGPIWHLFFLKKCEKPKIEKKIRVKFNFRRSISIIIAFYHFSIVLILEWSFYLSDFLNLYYSFCYFLFYLH